MSYLLNTPPQSVSINDIEYEIQSDYRVSIEFSILIEDADLSDYEKVSKALDLYYPVWPEDISAAIEKIHWFYRCGEIANEKESAGTAVLSDPVYSFRYDGKYIIPAFLEQYGIDPRKGMHWWDFKMLFETLSEDTYFHKVMRYRAVKLNDLPREQREFYRRMKRLHALPKNISKKEQEEMEALEKILRSDGNVSAILESGGK